MQQGELGIELRGAEGAGAPPPLDGAPCSLSPPGIRFAKCSCGEYLSSLTGPIPSTKLYMEIQGNYTQVYEITPVLMMLQNEVIKRSNANNKKHP